MISFNSKWFALPVALSLGFVLGLLSWTASVIVSFEPLQFLLIAATCVALGVWIGSITPKIFNIYIALYILSVPLLVFSTLLSQNALIIFIAGTASCLFAGLSSGSLFIHSSLSGRSFPVNLTYYFSGITAALGYQLLIPVQFASILIGLTAAWFAILVLSARSMFRFLINLPLRLKPLTKPDNALIPVMAGLHFGILQISLYFIIECFVTATYLGYFAVTIAWLTGVIINLKHNFFKTWKRSLTVSYLSLAVLSLITATTPPYHILLPVIFIFIVLVAAPAGHFFKSYSGSMAASALFFHENNGFVLGFVLSTAGFIQWGINYIYIAPLLSFIATLLTTRKNTWQPFLIIGLAFIAGITSSDIFVIIPFTLIVVLVILAIFIEPRPANIPIQAQSTRISRYQRAIIYLAGFNLLLLQFFIVRDYAIIIASTEITVLLVGATYFAGFSVGYGLSSVISIGKIRRMSGIIFLVHLVLLVFGRFSAGFLIANGLGGLTLILLLVLSTIGTSSFYSILLPKFIERGGSPTLMSVYSWDLAGAVTGSISIFIITYLFPGLILPLYFAILLALTYLLTEKSKWKYSAITIGIAVIIILARFGPDIQHLGTEDYYQTRGYDNPKLVYSENSFYNSVDVIDTFHDQKMTNRSGRWSFLNGIPYFGYRYYKGERYKQETGLSEFTYYLAELPAKYMYTRNKEKIDILILGCGSMYSIGRVSPVANSTTMVEIDNTVVESAKACWSDLNHWEKWDNYQLIVDDAKHFLATTDQKYDLIIMDISAPYTLGTMLLHNVDYYQTIRDHLKPGGLFAESTQGRPSPKYPNGQGMKILRGVTDVFPFYQVVDCTGPPRGRHGYVYGAVDSAIDSDIIIDIMIADKMAASTRIYSESNTRFNTSKTIPYSLTNMETLLTGNIWRIEDRLHLESYNRKNRITAGDLKLPAAISKAVFSWPSLVFIILLSGIQFLSARYYRKKKY